MQSEEANTGDGGKRRYRGHGEGSLVWLPSRQRWQVRVSATLPDGRRVVRAAYARTKPEALAKLAALRRTRPTATGAGGVRTVRELIAAWLSAAAPSLRPRTVAEYRRVAAQHVIPYLGRRRLTQLAPHDVATWLAGRTADGVGARTVQLAFAVLRRALTVAVRWGWLDQNPCTGGRVTPPRVPVTERPTFTVAEVGRLLAVVRGRPWEALYATAAVTGLRRGELLGLTWADIDLHQGTLTVQRQLQRLPAPDGGSVLDVAPPKTRRSRRTLVLPPALVAILQAHRAHRQTHAPPSVPDTDLVFASAAGTPLDPRNLTRRFHQDLARAGLPRRPFHALRHFAASELLRAGADLRLIQAYLGHASITVTGDVYAHVRPAQLAQAATVLADRLALPPPPRPPHTATADPSAGDDPPTT